MFVEYKEGSKHAGSGSERSEKMDAFKDCGLLLNDEDVVIDIDHLPKEAIKAMIEEFNIKTMIVWTDRGAHLWFKKPAWFKRRKDGICKLGFDIEQHTQGSNPNGMTVKRNGVPRPIDNEGIREYMPEIFDVSRKYKKLLGMADGEGRNKGLFNHRVALNNCDGWEKICRFINQHVFDEPLPEDEYQGIVRSNVKSSDEQDEQYWIASQFIEQKYIHKFSGMLWWFRDGQYFTEKDNGRLIREVYQQCQGKRTTYVDEIIKQIGNRCPIVDGDKPFPIRFRNGVMIKNRFLLMEGYRGFTPYYIDIDYKEDAPPVKMVDDYIDALTNKDPDYRKLLMEVIGYVMITDPEKIRSLGKFFMFRGDGANGKGTLLQIMKRIYNDKNCTNLSIKQLTDDRFKVTMIGKLANLGDDIEAEAIDNDQLKILKNISTADTVTTRHMYAEGETATFTTKLYFTTNSDIRSFEKGYAYKRRIVWLPMFNKVEKPDPTFISKITTPEALEYWIRLIVEGFLRLYQSNEWTACKAVEEYNDQYHEENNVSLQFARDLDPDTEIIGKTVTEIKEAFFEWSSDDRKFSSKLFLEAVWDLYDIGIGRSKQAGKTRKVFMKQEDTTQKLRH